MSKTNKRIVCGVIGIIYAVIYGFWTMFATGGDHGNFIWLMLFVFVDLFGLYFPLMEILGVDLGPRFSKIVFGSLITFNLVASKVMIFGWITEPAVERTSDFTRMVQINGIQGVLICAVAHFLPTLFFASLLIRAVLFGTPSIDDDRIVNLDLP